MGRVAGLNGMKNGTLPEALHCFHSVLCELGEGWNGDGAGYTRSDPGRSFITLNSKCWIPGSAVCPVSIIQFWNRDGEGILSQWYGKILHCHMDCISSKMFYVSYGMSETGMEWVWWNHSENWSLVIWFRTRESIRSYCMLSELLVWCNREVVSLWFKRMKRILHCLFHEWY